MKKLLIVVLSLVALTALMNIVSGRTAQAAPGAAPVTVLNTPLPVSVAGPGANAFNAVVCSDGSLEDCAPHLPRLFVVPAAKYAMIETISASCEATSSPGGIAPLVRAFSIHTTAGGKSGAYSFAPAVNSSSTSTFGTFTFSLVSTTQVTIYADAGSTVSLQLNSFSADQSKLCVAALSGHYYSVP